MRSFGSIIFVFFFFSSRRRHTRLVSDWSSDVCSSDLAKARFEKLWGMELDPKPGLTVVETIHAAKKREIRGMYIMGENPAMSDPDVDHARAALATRYHMWWQDIFRTEPAYTADCGQRSTPRSETVATLIISVR